MNIQSNLPTSINNVKTEVVLVTPSMADNWIKSTNIGNRSVSKHVVDVYAADMIADRWELTNQGIAFYEDGFLADGQHRLYGIIKANKSVLIQVTYGLKRSAINGIDQHRIRSIHDVLTMQGDQISAVEVAAVRLCYGLDKATASVVHSILHNVINEVRFLDDHAVKTNKKFTSSIIRASIALALKSGVDCNILAQFSRVLSSGIIEKEADRTIIVLREVLLSNPGQRNGSQRIALIKRIQQAIKNYSEGKIVTRSLTPAEYVYPLLKIEY